MEAQLKPPPTIFLSYAQKDEELKQEFDDYLIILQQSQLIAGWVERQVQRGIDWSQVIDPRIFDAEIVLAFLSPALLASGYASGAELREVLVRRDAGQARVIPVILHRVNLVRSPFEAILSLPRNARAISSWPERRKAWEDIDMELTGMLKRYRLGY